MKIQRFFITIVGLLLFGPGNVAASVISTFDASAEGWSGAVVSHSSTGGNPDGYLHFVDPDSSGNSLLAPSSFLGDWSAYEGGTLSYDHRIFEATGVNQFVDYEIEITGSGGFAVWTSGAPATGTTSWVTLVAPIIESSWSVTGDWSSLILNVTQLRIRLEHVDDAGTDIEGIDNIALSASVVSVPPSIVLFVGALLCLPYSKRKKFA